MLTSKQRAYLRALANSYETLFQVGKGGISDALVTQTDEALTARELIKMKCLENSGMTAREAADALALKCRANVVQVIGSKLILYRPAPEVKDRKIVLPVEKKGKKVAK